MRWPSPTSARSGTHPDPRFPARHACGTLWDLFRPMEGLYFDFNRDSAGPAAWRGPRAAMGGCRFRRWDAPREASAREDWGDSAARRALIVERRELRKRIKAAPKRSAERREPRARLEALRARWRKVRTTFKTTEPKSMRSRHLALAFWARTVFQTGPQTPAPRKGFA
jgi:hypothetical protein